MGYTPNALRTPRMTWVSHARRTERSSRDLEFLQRIYASNRDWYMVAEKKAQLLLTIDGAFLAIVFGVVSGDGGGTGDIAAHFGPETWVFALTALSAVVGSILCAALSMWSLHSRGVMKRLEADGLDTQNVATYRPEWLWYFGHLARLAPEHAASRLQHLTEEDEIATISYHTVDLAQRVLRKFQYVNAGWALAAIGLVAVAATTASSLTRAVAQ
jgi:hypothetical protein